MLAFSFVRRLNIDKLLITKTR